MLKYRSLYERYRALVARGAWGPGERLPSLRRVARDEGVALNTARAAFELLERDGLVEPFERGGFYVRGRASLAACVPPAACHEVEGLSASQKIDLLLAEGGASASFALAGPDPSLLPAARLARLCGSLPGDWIEYGDQAGDPELRRRIAAACGAGHGDLDPEDIVVTCGATEALSVAFGALVGPGDSVVVESPTYYEYFRQLAARGARVVEVPVAPGRGLDLDLLERALTRTRAKAMVVQPNVQNPTGSVMPDGDKARLLELASRSGAYLIQDDVYGDLAFSQARPSNLDAAGGYERLVYLSSFSKTLAPGLRVGWLHAPALRRELARAKGLQSLSTSRPAQRALAAYLSGPAYRRHLDLLRRAFEAQLADYLSTLAAVLPEGSAIAPPAGGCLLWIGLPGGRDASRAFEAAVREGLYFAPGELFSANPYFRSHLRINFGRRLTEGRRAELARLGAILSAG